MSTLEELKAQIEEARRVGRLLDEERVELQNNVSAAEERQRLRRILDEIHLENQGKRIDNTCFRGQQRMVDEDKAGPHMPRWGAHNQGSLSKAPQKEPCYVDCDEDVANCRFNVFKKEHVWKIEGMSWLKSTLKQAERHWVKSQLIQVGPQGGPDEVGEFQIHYTPYGVEDRVCFHNDEDDFYSNLQVGSLAVCYWGEGGIAFRHRLYIKQRGEFVQWGEQGDVCDTHTGSTCIGRAFGPDVQKVTDKPLRPIGVFGLSHDDLLKSDWIEDDVLTVKLELEVRTDLFCAAVEYVSSYVDVPPSDIIANWRDLLRDGKHSDITFIVDGERIEAHSLVLSMRSEVFDRLLHGGMRESLEREVHVDECDATAFRSLLDFLYTDEFCCMEKMLKDRPTEERSSSLQSVLAMSHRYQIMRLQLWCEHQLSNCMTVEDVCQITCQAYLFEARQLMQACLDFIKVHFAQVVATPSFGRLSTEWPEVLISINISLAGITESSAAAARRACLAAKGRACEESRDAADDKGVIDRGGNWYALASTQTASTPELLLSGDTDDVFECRVLESWTGDGEGYLDLHQDELLMMKPQLEDGWAFGHSRSRGVSGWFPPTFVSRVAVASQVP
eukprot:TRINITY_DN91220_c0_g1_i1.p1 TRINITY_DN91220_c0_g1~~TRINITY_DN91220_c0_g1_i1.p1  ORF type:complete len:616 (+),score=133.77 TRINITY_DN91220_c0_g1_i1:72-1919(+)